VVYYRREGIKVDWLSDEAAHINNRLSSLLAASSLKVSGLAPDFAAVFEAAALIYRARWWQDHDHANRAWMAAVAPLTSKHSAILRKQLRLYIRHGLARQLRSEPMLPNTRTGRKLIRRSDQRTLLFRASTRAIPGTPRSKSCFLKRLPWSRT
jgi:hypothetical protein